MSSTTTAAPGSPRWSDHRNRRAGMYEERTGARKNRARAQSLSPQRISQIKQGDPTGSVERWFEWIENAARHRSVNVWPLINGSIGLVTEIEAEETDNAWPDLHQVMDNEARRQAKEDVAWHRFVMAWQTGDEDRIREAAADFIEAAELEMDAQARAIGLARVVVRRLP